MRCWVCLAGSLLWFHKVVIMVSSRLLHSFLEVLKMNHLPRSFILLIECSCMWLKEIMFSFTCWLYAGDCSQLLRSAFISWPATPFLCLQGQQCQVIQGQQWQVSQPFSMVWISHTTPFLHFFFVPLCFSPHLSDSVCLFCIWHLRPTYLALLKNPLALGSDHTYKLT